MSDPFDYLFLEPLLIERIRSEVPGLAIVSGVPDLAALSEQDQPAPSVYVVYLGDEIGTGADHQGAGAPFRLSASNGRLCWWCITPTRRTPAKERAERQDRCWDGWSRH
ncbi:hypothetical protein P7I89_22225 [Pseudomonas aeruginosa]|nr:hypothetical protein P7I89_22225 [Pseudomonas aeruginosa]